MVSVLALSVTFGATSPKGRGLGSPFALHLKEQENFTKKCKKGAFWCKMCIPARFVISYKGVQK